MGILYMTHACNEVVGVSVDTHVRRISNRIGLANTREPLNTQMELERIVPKSPIQIMSWLDLVKQSALPRNQNVKNVVLRTSVPAISSRRLKLFLYSLTSIASLLLTISPSMLLISLSLSTLTPLSLVNEIQISSLDSPIRMQFL